MRVLHVSQSDGGGAGIAARRLHLAERTAGIDSRMMVLQTHGDDMHTASPPAAVRLRARAMRFAARRIAAGLHRGTPGTLSLGAAPSGFGRAIALDPADVVHLHWVGAETLGIGEIARLERQGRALAWTLHDTWPVSGAEHYRSGPPGTAGPSDRWVWARKRRLWANLAPGLICPSRWIADEVRAASPFGPGQRVAVIPNTLDPDVFRLRDRGAARAALGLPQEAPVLLFGAQASTSDPRKGFDLLTAALERVEDRTLTLAVFGAAGGPGEIAGHPVRWLGRIGDEETLATAYAAADAFAAPSRQDNLPNTVLEALFCGTPSAAFAVGGLPDMIEPGRTGALAQPFDAADFARAIGAALAIRDRQGIRAFALERFGPETVAARHLDLYRTLLEAA